MLHALILSQDLVSLDWTFVAELIAFLILMYLLVRILYRPVTTALNNRANAIKSGLAAAEEAARAAENAQLRTKEQLDEARSQAQEILRQANVTAGSMREQTINEARAEAQKVIERGKAEIERERQAAVDELRRVVADMAILAATRVVEKSLDTQDNRRLIEEAIAQTSGFATPGRP
ncbi:MAG: F-type H+-transporting ATPase subunit b [Chloroflexi bacterium]|nr:F-type H+-transporting ATPase subunit b [Chloroflexota bacterium]MDB5076563.1 F-type H+-transporting ATPase subunit b [Chloroflexota bacterium]